MDDVYLVRRGPDGSVTVLIPLDPARIEVVTDQDTGQVRHYLIAGQATRETHE